jgi:competence protein ComGC
MLTRSHSTSDARGFALVEILLAGLVVSILVAVLVMAIANVNDDGSAARSCRSEAREFAVAVQSYHVKHENRAWPDDHVNGSVQLTSDALVFTGELRGPTMKYLAGPQRVPSTSKPGWTYDFKTHTTNSLSCG